MKWPTHIIAVAGLVYNKKGQILVAKSKRKNTWTFLGGQVEVGENLEEALKREIFEESNIIVDVDRLIGIYSNVQETIWYDKKVVVPTKLIIDFNCKFVSGELKPSDETPELKWVTSDEALIMFTHPVFRLRLKNYLNFKNKISYDSFKSQPFEHLFSRDF